MTRLQDDKAIQYIRELYAPEDALSKKIREQLDATHAPMQMGSEECRLLQVLMGMNKVKTIVEIGTLAGHSAIWMARALPHDGHIDTITVQQDHANWARGYIKESDVANKITVHLGDAHDVLKTLETNAPYDMAFVDADKQSYPDYLDWAEAHLRKDGLLIADNTLLFGFAYQDNPPKGQPPEGIAPATWKAMRTFNERLADKTKWDGVMIPTLEGLSVARKVG